MTNINQQHIEANKLRKLGNDEEALPLYRELWGKTCDKYDGTGLLHCLRRLKLFSEAIILADDLLSKYPDFEWAQYEIIWTYIQGRLNVLDDDTPIQTLLIEANRIMSLNPKNLAAKTIVFKVLKTAKISNNWKIINDWITRIDPSSLSIVPTATESGKEGWSEQSQWYNYRIKGIIEQHDNEEKLFEAVRLADKAIQLFPKQNKFFLRLKASSYSEMGKYEEAAEIYHNLCAKPKADWWLLHEYALVLQAQNQENDALKLMYQAANSNYKLESMVTLFFNIGQLCNKMEKYKEARAHLLLCKYIREDKGWGISEQITSLIHASNLHLNDSEPASQKEALDICRSEWGTLLHKEGLEQISSNKREIKRALLGKVNSIRPDRSFFFITTADGQSFFCGISQLPPMLNNGDEVRFDAIPSFDKKKNKESYSAVNLNIASTK